jgi:hypothetical protein
LRKSKYFTKFNDIFENIRKTAFPIILNKKMGSYTSLNTFRKLRENMYLLKNGFKISNEVQQVMTPIVMTRYVSIKKALIFSYFFKTAVLKLKLKTSNAYRKNIMNLMRYSKMSI